MTAIASPVLKKSAPARPSPGFLWLLPASILAFVFPHLTRAWTSVSLLRAWLIAICHTVAGFLWAYFVVVSAYVWRDDLMIKKDYGSVWSLAALRFAARSFAISFRAEWQHANFFDRYSPFLALLAMMGAAFLLPYFVLLPFAARPGPNKPCLRHVARTILLGSGVVHWWGATYVAIVLSYAVRQMPSLTDEYARGVTPLLLAFSLLSVWTLVVLGIAARRDYRTAADHPEPHDPWCDDCGYVLMGIDPAGRCPECGRLIAESIGPHNRPVTPWESRPSLLNIRVIARQIRAIIFRPRTLFFSMPTLTGQAAAQRWLLASAVVLFVLALPIVPALYVALHAKWNFALVASSLAMGLAWAVFGLMMVGVETAGIATFSRLRRHKVYLSTAAKVTAYSALLMVPWIFLGGAQLVAYTTLASENIKGVNGIQHLFHVGLRGEQVVLAASLSIAHIGGLLWYELTVYRGIRAIQYANK